jgi:hypothetical protein
MIIDNNLLAISKCMFQERNRWKFVTDEQKNDNFFIINRYFSKQYPYLAQLLNDKTTDKVSGMDLWFYFMEGKPYPKWFWSKSEKSKDDSIFSEKEINSLLNKFDIKQEELDLLIEYHLDDVKEELKYIKDGEKGNK